jgi:hypothetical protein
VEKKAKTAAGGLQEAMAKPIHSMISAKKLGAVTYSKNPPTGILYPVSPGLRK